MMLVNLVICFYGTHKNTSFINNRTHEHSGFDSSGGGSSLSNYMQQIQSNA